MNIHLDCWCSIILFLYSNKTYKNLCFSIKGLCKYSKIQNPWCLENIIYKIYKKRKIEEWEQKKVTLINWNFKNLKKIKGLENLVKLKELNLSANKISRIEENLVQLKELHLYANEISKIEGLENLVQLNELIKSRK